MKQPQIHAVAHDIALHCHDELDRPMAFMATFGYRPDDPYAVRVILHMAEGDSHWIMSRTLLLRGRLEICGEGNIELRPGIDEDGRAVVLMTFYSPVGRLMVEARTVDIETFLRPSVALVPLGTESEYVDLDALSTALLTDA